MIKCFFADSSCAGARLLFLPLCLLVCSLNVAGQVPERATLRDDRPLLNQTEAKIAPDLLNTKSTGTDNEEMTVAAPRMLGGQSAKSTYVFPTSSERFKRYLRDTFGPWTLVGVAGAAAIGQWENNPPEWRQGASGYGKRYASSFGQNAIQETTSYGLSEALRLDTGFTRSTRHGFGPRLGDALIQNVTSRNRSGKRVISVPRLSSFYVGGIVPAVTWYPQRFGVKDGFRAGNYSLLTGFAVNVLREFILRR